MRRSLWNSTSKCWWIVKPLSKNTALYNCKITQPEIVSNQHHTKIHDCLSYGAVSRPWSLILTLEHMSRDMTKPKKMTVRPAKTQINLVIRTVWVFAVRSMGSQGPKLSSCGQRTLIRLGWCPGWSESSLSAWRKLDAQADLSLRWAHIHFVGFVMMRLIFGVYNSMFLTSLRHAKCISYSFSVIAAYTWMLGKWSDNWQAHLINLLKISIYFQMTPVMTDLCLCCSIQRNQRYALLIDHWNLRWVDTCITGRECGIVPCH